MKKTVDKTELINLINQGYRPTEIAKHLTISRAHFYRLKSKLEEMGALKKREVIRYE